MSKKKLAAIIGGCAVVVVVVLVVLLASPTYTLTVASTAGGTVTTPEEGTSKHGEGTVAELAAEPEEGYRFVNWTATAGEFDDANLEETTFTMPAEDVTVTANFELIPTYSVTMAVSPAGGGTAVDLTDGSPYEAGTSVTIRAEAAEGYEFTGWTASAGVFADADAAETTFTVPGEDVTIAATFFEGELIHDWHDLHAVAGNLSGSFLLMNDLDETTPGYAQLAGPHADAGKGWQPIGTWADRFTGTFDGGGYEISGVYIDRPEDVHIGLLGFVDDDGIIENVRMGNAYVKGNTFVASLAGVNSGTIRDSSVDADVSGSYHVGGLVGDNRGTVSDCHAGGSVTGDSISSAIGGLVGHNSGTVADSASDADVTWGGYHAGGLVGWNEGTVSDCYSSGSVRSYAFYGGLVGYNDGAVSKSHSDTSVTGYQHGGGLVGYNSQQGTVTGSSAAGSAEGSGSIGGLVGTNHRGRISNSYATGMVVRSTGDETLFGGFVGYNYQAKILNCYSTGSVHYEGAADPTDKGFAGSVDTGGNYEMSGNFWDTETNGQTSTAGDATGMTTGEMMDITTFAGWHIIAVAPGQTNPTHTWNIVVGETYPFLSWQTVS